MMGCCNKEKSDKIFGSESHFIYFCREICYNTDMQGLQDDHGTEALSRKGRLIADFQEQFGEAPAYFFSSPGFS